MGQNKFTKSVVSSAIAGAVVFAASSVSAQPLNSIADSWHNLGSGNTKGATPNGGTPANHSTQTGEICVFCHTPHGGDNSAAVPIWNRVLNDPANYTRYSQNNSTTFDAAEGPIGSTTIACLSCHDGAQAIDALINAPGSGNYTDWTSVPFGDAAYLAWAGGSTSMVGADINPATGALASGIVQNLGVDLSNDHPVSMQYGGGGVTGAGGVATGTTVDPDFTQVGTARSINDQTGAAVNMVMNAKANPSATINTVFWIERSDSLNPNDRDRNDVILYTRNFGGQFQPFVECGSCHDPHNVDNPTFLRTSNGIPSTNQTLAAMFPDAVNDPASGLCLTCHAK